MTDFQCHYRVQHGPHPWNPLIADPENDHVLYVSDEPVPCPGLTAEEAARLRASDATDTP